MLPMFPMLVPEIVCIERREDYTRDRNAATRKPFQIDSQGGFSREFSLYRHFAPEVYT